jgi:hypothetical protein
MQAFSQGSGQQIRSRQKPSRVCLSFLLSYWPLSHSGSFALLAKKRRAALGRHHTQQSPEINC